MSTSRTCLRRETSTGDARVLNTVVSIQRVDPTNICRDEAMAAAKLPCCGCGWVQAAPISSDGRGSIATRGAKLPACHVQVRTPSIRLAIDIWRLDHPRIS